MDAGSEAGEPGRRPTLAASWDAAGGVLTQSLVLVRAGVGARDPDWEELLAPPAPGQGLVRLERSPGSQDEAACFLYLLCDPEAGDAVAAVGVLSSARNMEVYLGQEYCGTSRGESVGAVPRGSEQEIVFYKKYLKLESSARACKIKLLSLGEKQCVFLSRVVVHVRSVPANSSTRSPALGSRIDLDKVQTMMQSMGSKLSPGAQQLMNMVRFQQQNRIPVGEQLQVVLGSPGYQHLGALQSPAAAGAPAKSACTPVPVGTALAPGDATESTQVHGGENTAALDRCGTEPQTRPALASELRTAVSEKAGEEPGVLPFLQTLCGQLSRVRVAGATERREGRAPLAMETQPVCSYLEKILSKNMELMEKKLMDYIDERVHRLQEHVDRQLAVVVDLLQNPSAPPAGLPLTRYDSGERLSNGER
ncbi:ATPase PAAT-like isoform X1 [Lepus europaeus]|uniref:ATPase PAAT-like isoform X1 n=1 Tax=Lepus europaeus TaxID=9983 RepID=UPI002B47BE53|nr:ATPase PAAT-like isoform X1 [Lepus europaeus]